MKSIHKEQAWNVATKRFMYRPTILMIWSRKEKRPKEKETRRARDPINDRRVE